MRRGKAIIKKITPFVIIRIYRKLKTALIKLGEYPIIKLQPYFHKRCLRIVRKKIDSGQKVKVAFFVNYASIWKHEEIYKMFYNDSRFDTYVIIAPVTDHGMAYMIEEMSKASQAFRRKGIEVVCGYDKSHNRFLNVKKTIAPDMVFFTNPHANQTIKKFHITNYKNTLTCYTQYAYHVTFLNDLQYNQLFHNIVWRAFYETKFHRKIAIECSRNNASNVVVSGYAGIEKIKYSVRTNDTVWLNQDNDLKRIIWAPHHTVDPNGKTFFSNFLKYHQIMIEIAKKYSNFICIAFKPHPHLKIKLYSHPEWGKDRTDDYYKLWDELKNTQLETNDYINLFNTSDAMIFDSTSFIAEYLYTGKPSLFTITNENVFNLLNDFGKQAIKNHYHGYDENDIEKFIIEVVCEEIDTMKEKRKSFYETYLMSSNLKKPSKNIYDYICKELEMQI